MKTITVVGMGYIGLPLVVAFSSKNFNVWGFDISEEKIANLKKGIFPEVDTNYKPGKINFTTDPKECLPISDFIIICVPSPLKKDNSPDISFIESAAKIIKKHLKKDQTVILESTCYPGTTEEVIKPILEETGLKAGTDFGLAFCPERIGPGYKPNPLEKMPKIIGAINEKYANLIKELYESIIEETYIVKNIKTAEAVKLMENTFRFVNISLVNELSLLFEKMGLNSYEVIEAAGTKPAGFMKHFPGPGVGGDCIPVVPFFLSWKAKEFGEKLKFIDLAGEINTRMPQHVVDLIEKNSDKKDKVLVLGVTYKPNIPDTRSTPSEPIIETLKKKREVKYFDPLIKTFLSLDSEKNLKSAIENSDVVVIVVAHQYFKDAGLDKLLSDKTVIDTCNFFNKEVGKKYIGLGKPQA